MASNLLLVALACYIISVLNSAESINLSEDEGLPCAARDFGHSSFVCVCNSTYCDTLPRPVLPPEGEYVVYSSDISNKRFSKTSASFNDGASSKGQLTADFTLDLDTAFQTVIGWGGAFTDSAAANILSLSDNAQDLLLRSYFSTDGLEYNLGRINMGGCDFSWRTYSYDDVEGDITLEHFALAPEDVNFKIPVIQRAMAMSARPLKLFGSPWTAPAWMKTNDDFIGYGQLRDDMYQPWAEYFVKFLDSYASNNISIWGLTAQNEPLDGYIPDFYFNCMGWTEDQQRRWIANNLGPTLQSHGYDHVMLMILDDQRIELPKWANVILNDSDASQYVDGIAIHWYTDHYVASSHLDETHEQFPGHFILGTEACEGFGPLQRDVVLGSWERLESYASDIIEDMNHWVTGWTDWNIALDMKGGPNWANNFVDAPIIVDQASDEFYKNPMFYAMGHFSKFVVEGAVRIAMTSLDDKNLETVAFTNPDGTHVIVILNRSDDEIEARISVAARGTMNVIAEPRSIHTAIFV